MEFELSLLQYVLKPRKLIIFEFGGSRVLVMKGSQIIEQFLRDLRYAARSLWRAKGFALTVLLAFAVCIAANTALFAIVNSVVLRPLPVPDANSILLM